MPTASLLQDRYTQGRTCGDTMCQEKKTRPRSLDSLEFKMCIRIEDSNGQRTKLSVAIDKAILQHEVHIACHRTVVSRIVPVPFSWPDIGDLSFNLPLRHTGPMRNYALAAAGVQGRLLPAGRSQAWPKSTRVLSGACVIHHSTFGFPRRKYLAN